MFLSISSELGVMATKATVIPDVRNKKKSVNLCRKKRCK